MEMWEDGGMMLNVKRSWVKAAWRKLRQCRYCGFGAYVACYKQFWFLKRHMCDIAS